VDLLTGHELSGPPDQERQQPQGAVRKPDPHARLFQLLGPKVELKFQEREQVRTHTPDFTSYSRIIDFCRIDL
jgi:hypothetical protein